MRRLLSLSDGELIESIRAGHDKAFEALLYRYENDIRNVIRHYVKDRLTAEDLSQEASLKIYTSLKSGKYNEQGKLLPWALRIARNLCMDHLRKAAQFPPVTKLCYDDYLSTYSNQNAEHRLTVKQQEQQLNAFIEGLPEDQKKVVHYRYFEDLSFKEIAALMNTSVNTSLGRMRYGLAHLRKQVNRSPALAWR